MKSFVITITSLEASLRSAQRAQESAEAHGVSCDLWEATTPYTLSSDPETAFLERGWPTGKFLKNKWSKPGPTMCVFLSHASLWEECSKGRECFLILEHDAVVTDTPPNLYWEETICCNVARPSFGRFNTPQEGFRLFSSGPQGFFKGLHGYIVSPSGSRGLLEKTREAEPADVFVNRRRFPWLTEFYPWSVECRDEFSTIQNEAGCKAKHRKVLPVDWEGTSQ